MGDVKAPLQEALSANLSYFPGRKDFVDSKPEQHDSIRREITKYFVTSPSLRHTSLHFQSLLAPLWR